MDTFTSDQLDQLEADDQTLVFVTHEDSRATRLLRPVIKVLESKYSRKGLTFYEFSLNEDPELAQQLKVRIAPTLILLQGSNELGRMYDYNSIEKLSDFIDLKLANAPEPA